MFKQLRELVARVTQGQPSAASQTGPQARRNLRLAPVPPLAPVALPRQSVDPRRFTGTDGVGAWVLGVPSRECACEFALANVDRRFSAAGVVPLPTPERTRIDCACSYRAQPEQRVGARRIAAERREEVRFKTKKIDRRRNSGRRVEDAWDRKRV